MRYIISLKLNKGFKFRGGNSYSLARSAFTLSEVLITLGIIGIVAALTIPSLLTNFKKRETVAKVKAAYSILSQAVKLSVEENGETSGWDTSVESEVMPKYILPYLTGATRLNIDSRKYTLKTLSSTPGAYGAYIIYVLQNGMFFSYRNLDDGYPTIIVDINGLNKPNVMGIDGFSFWIDPKTSSVVPAGAVCSRDALLNKNNGWCADIVPLAQTRACQRGEGWIYYRGGYCAALMQKDGWTISKDYPW